MKNPLESDIQSTICDYLAIRMRQGKLMFWRQNTQPAVYKKGDQMAFRRMPKYSMRGVADIIVIKDGFAVFLEVKRKGTRQSPEQLEFERLVKSNRAEYYVVRDLKEVQEIGL